MVYRVKYGADGQMDKYKARYVVKGFVQVEGLDFFETYAHMQTRDFQNPISSRRSEGFTYWASLVPGALISFSTVAT